MAHDDIWPGKQHRTFVSPKGLYTSANLAVNAEHGLVSRKHFTGLFSLTEYEKEEELSQQ